MYEINIIYTHNHIVSSLLCFLVNLMGKFVDKSNPHPQTTTPSPNTLIVFSLRQSSSSPWNFMIPILPKLG